MRTHYKNGDEITLQGCGCDGCNPMIIDGILCHEHGCPNAWRDYIDECKWCGQTFIPEQAGQEFCGENCAECYNT